MRVMVTLVLALAVINGKDDDVIIGTGIGMSYCCGIFCDGSTKFIRGKSCDDDYAGDSILGGC